MKIASAQHAARLYGSRGATFERTLTHLEESLDRAIAERETGELTIAFLGEDLAVAGVPVVDAPSSVLRLAGILRRLDIDIISIERGVSRDDLDALFAFLAADPSETAATRADTWLAERGVERIKVEHMRLGAAGETFKDVYWQGRKALDQEFVRAREEGFVQEGTLTDLAGWMLELLAEAKTPIGTLLALRDRSDFALVHSINVAMLVGVQITSIGLSDDAAMPIILAALLHDIGKTRVPDALLAGGAVTDREIALMDRHTVEGARIIFQTSGLDPICAAVALEHHTRLQPRVVKREDAGMLAIETCRIADVFDSIRTLRPFEDPNGMRGAVAYMVRRLASRFNPYLLERFAAIANLFQPGDCASLSTGETVCIARSHDELGLHPVVEILERGTGRIRSGTTIDLATPEIGTPASLIRVLPAMPPMFADLDPDALRTLA
jgi:HD-GYP domain-containing protein (c-di-GMP phosphodiesterase class II)